MGCDIHAYVEYRTKVDKTKSEDQRGYSGWWSLTGQLSLPRSYRFFEIIAGVRGDNSVFEAKGIPEDMSWTAQDDWYIYINDAPESEDEEDECDCENIVSLKTALQYEKYGSKILYHENGKPYRVEHPDWHTPTWLSTSELNEAVSHLSNHADPAYEAVLAMMESLESNGKEARLVVWFDN